MPMQPPKPTVPTSLPMYFMVSKSAKQGTTCSADTRLQAALMPCRLLAPHAALSQHCSECLHCVHMCLDRAASRKNDLI